MRKPLALLASQPLLSFWNVLSTQVQQLAQVILCVSINRIEVELLVLDMPDTVQKTKWLSTLISAVTTLTPALTSLKMLTAAQ